MAADACGALLTLAAATRAPKAPVLADVSGDVATFKLGALDATNLVACSTYVPRRVFPMHGVPGRNFVNYAVGKQWQGMLTKTKALLQGAKERAATSPDGLIILMDTDVINGGCSDAVLRDRYERIVRVSGGAPVLVGADPYQWPDIPGFLGRFQDTAMQARRNAILAEFGMNSRDLDAWQLPNAVSYSFVNSGFIMGPAWLVVKVIECSLAFGWMQENYFNDQGGMQQCASRHPNIITIDYTGTIVLDTNGLKPGFLRVTPAGIQNTLLGGPQCFVHLDGHTQAQEHPWYQWYHHLPRFAHPAP